MCYAEQLLVPNFESVNIPKRDRYGVVITQPVGVYRDYGY